MNRSIAALAACLAPAAIGAAGTVAAPLPQEVAPGVHLLRGAMLPGRGPDGNTILFEAPRGLVVVDTGRHDWHSDAILAFAAERQRPIVAIVNTHWHLDHSSGNGRIKAAHPAARLYTTRAVERVLAEGGFLARNLAAAERRLADPNADATEREEIAIFVQTMEQQAQLRPDVAVEKSGDLALAGRLLELRLAERAVTDADLWIHDRATGLAVLGDLVTLPAPFFETACPEAWRGALDEVRALPFRIAIPGHGEPMDRAQFETYRSAFGAFLDCVAGDTEAAQCAAGWQSGVAPLVGEDARMRRMALAYAEYYAGMLRANGGQSADCLAR